MPKPPNAHQRYTGINLPEGQHGTWRSLSGSECGDIQRIYQEVTGEIPTASDIANAKWVLGGSVFSGTPAKCSDLEEYRGWLTSSINPTPPPPSEHNGLLHDWRKARAAWLYPGIEDLWLPSHRMCLWTPETIASYLDHPDIYDTTHCIIAANTARRPKIGERNFNCLEQETKVRAVFEQVIRAGKAPILWCMSQEFFQQTLDGSHAKLLDHLEKTCALLADLCQIAVPFREMGEIYGGHSMKQRNQIFRAMRKGAPTLPLACHERPLAQIPVDDFKNVDGDVISGLQVGFPTPTGGQGRARDKVVAGDGEVYDGGCGFIRANGRRMSQFQQNGHMERHTNAVFEHSIPLVYPRQQWTPTRDIESAQARGKAFLKHGAAFDLSSGVKA
jgi:hypothetical protein